MEPTSPNSFGNTPYRAAGMGAGTVVPVGKGTRFVEFFIDVLALGAVSYAVGLVLGTLGIVNYGLSTLVSAVLNFAFYYFQEKGSGLTIGKRVMGTKAVMLDGSPLTDEAALKRSLWRLLNFILAIDAFSFLFGERGLHDSQSGTTVISTK